MLATSQMPVMVSPITTRENPCVIFLVFRDAHVRRPERGCAGTTSDTELTHTGFQRLRQTGARHGDPGARIYLKGRRGLEKYDKVMLDRIQVWLKDDADTRASIPPS